MLIKNEYKPKMLPRQAKAKKPVTSNGRIIFVLAALGAGFLALLGRSLYLQTSHHDFLTDEGNKRFVRTVKLPASRGVISDRNGATLALSAPAESLYAVPSSANLSDGQIEELAALLDISPDTIRDRLDRKSSISYLARRLDEDTVAAVQAINIDGLYFRDETEAGKPTGRQALYVKPNELAVLPDDGKLQQLADVLNPAIQSKLDKKSVETLKSDMGKKIDFVYLKRQLKPELAERIAAMHIPGLAFQKEPQRHYPTGSLFAQTIGFTNIDGQGQEGLERSREAELHGRYGEKTVLRDNKGQIVDSADSGGRESQNGRDIVLAMDQRIQTLAADELAKAVDYHNAQSGSAVVLDARTGEILALVNGPSYDPNEPGSVDADQRRNRAITDIFEFGSVMKPFPIAKALDDGKISPRSSFDTRPYSVGGHPVRDTHVYPALDVRGIVQKSSNVGTSKISLMYRPEEMYGYYRSLGFGSKAGVGFPGEAGGTLRNWKNWGKFDQATMSFGYGMQMSLLQLARAYTVLTTDGRLIPVSLEKLESAPAGERILKPETAKEMRKIMVSVTEQGGTGRSGAVEGFAVAAKTGTAQKVVGRGYARDKHIGTFVGFAPAENPRVIVAVTIDEPRANGYYGGVVAGPVFKNIMAGSLNILGVRPTRSPAGSQVAAVKK
ncbi:Penicillin-binding protein 2 [Kingella potus]|uniref:Peptidoglycan D,D-transpeptidase FtsI n=1 Tax=Kingella potus TaxID=265175 RepID=A0A377R1Z2_9NEIS|nr:penicillin-binding protein 2 [Kingella potus]STR00778.1 Penicillin-binding protein 2 [Kingella potus]